jgi:hypothetical protein
MPLISIPIRRSVTKWQFRAQVLDKTDGSVNIGRIGKSTYFKRN